MLPHGIFCSLSERGDQTNRSSTATWAVRTPSLLVESHEGLPGVLHRATPIPHLSWFLPRD